MHDLDRTQLEAEQFEQYEYEQEGEGEEFVGGILNSFVGGGAGDLESGLNETQELELASELLEVQSEEELEQFLGNLLSAAAGAARQFARSDTGRALGGILKGAAQQALPVVGRAIGQAVPVVGGDLGATLAQRAGSLLGLELEGLSPQDQEFEAARQFVRFGGAAARHAARAPRSVSSRTAARASAAAAAQRYAPGLVRVVGGSYGRPRPRRLPDGYRRPYRYGRRPWGPTLSYGYGVEEPGDGGYEPEPWEEPDFGGGEEPHGPPEDGDAYGGFQPTGRRGPSQAAWGGASSRANGGGRARAGRWVRRNRVIVIYGA